MISCDKLLLAIEEGDTDKFEALLDRLKKRSDKNKANSLQYIMHHLSSYISEKTRPHLLQFLSRLFDEEASQNNLGHNSQHLLKNLFRALNDDPELCASIAELFLKHGLDLNDPTAVYEAVKCCLPSVVQRFLDAGYNPNTLYTFQDRSEFRYILNAAISRINCCRIEGNPQLYQLACEVARVLLEGGADPNLSVDDPDGMAAIFYCEEPSTVQLLLDHGADVDVRGPNERRMLDISIIDDDIDMARFLLEHGADPNLRGTYGCSTIFYAQSEEAIRLLASHGAELNILSDKGNMPLIQVYSHLIPALIEAGADLNFRDKQGRTALHLCCRHIIPSSRIIQSLIQAGADLNARDDCGMTPFLTLMFSKAWLHYGMYMGDLAEFMVEHGADIYAKDSSGRSIFDIKSQAMVPIINRIKEMYEHIRTREQVLEEDTDTFAR